MAAHHEYGRNSSNKLRTCHPKLQHVARQGLIYSPYDISIIHGWRGEAEQNALYDSGLSRVRWPDSRHNKSRDPAYAYGISDAIDFMPYLPHLGERVWEQTHIFACIAGCFFAAAVEVGVTLRWGGDWDGDGDTQEHRLQDWGHIELVWLD